MRDGKVTADNAKGPQIRPRQINAQSEAHIHDDPNARRRHRRSTHQSGFRQTSSFAANPYDSSPASDSALAAIKLQKSYSGRRVVDDVSLHVEKGEVVGLLGANGAGKTTTFYMIVGLERPDSGVVSLGDQDVTKFPMYLRARLGSWLLAAGAINFSQDDGGAKYPGCAGNHGTAPA